MSELTDAISLELAELRDNAARAERSLAGDICVRDLARVLIDVAHAAEDLGGTADILEAAAGQRRTPAR